MKQIEEKVKLLKIKLDQHQVSDADNLLSEISELNDPKSVSLLVPLFDDEYPYDEIMYSIIHTIEDFEDEVYAKMILGTIPEFIYSSPRWASIVHMRILNSETTKISYIRECSLNASVEQKVSIKKLLIKINEVDAEFLVQTIPLLGVL